MIVLRCNLFLAMLFFIAIGCCADAAACDRLEQENSSLSDFSVDDDDELLSNKSSTSFHPGRQQQPSDNNNNNDNNKMVPVVVVVPPNGGVYTLSQHLPIIGRHHFYFEILNETVAYLNVSGTIVVDEDIPYQPRTDGTFDFTLSPKAIRTLRWPYGIRIQTVGYLVESDQPYMDIQAAIFAKWRLVLDRQPHMPCP